MAGKQLFHKIPFSWFNIEDAALRISRSVESVKILDGQKSTGKNPCIRQDLHWSASKGQLAIWSGAPVSRICLAHVSGITIYDGRLGTGQPLSISGLPCGMYLVSYESGHASGCFGIYVD